MGNLLSMLKTLLPHLPKLLEFLMKKIQEKSSSIPASQPSTTEKPSQNSNSNLPYQHLLASTVAQKYGIPNIPNDEQKRNLQLTNLNIYTPIKTGLDKLGKTLQLQSGFRSAELNAHPEVGGSENSDHCKGLALDLTCFEMSPKDLYVFIKNLNLPFKQLILEPGWVHVSLDLSETPRKQCLEAYYAKTDKGRVLKYKTI
jgi:uncharacterized protein YcbK (DUF882 family)